MEIWGGNNGLKLNQTPPFIGVANNDISSEKERKREQYITRRV